eukprot:scaffold17515_cov30-Tisochrysis_lutea.AAC.4
MGVRGAAAVASGVTTSAAAAKPTAPVAKHAVPNRSHLTIFDGKNRPDAPFGVLTWRPRREAMAPTHLSSCAPQQAVACCG